MTTLTSQSLIGGAPRRGATLLWSKGWGLGAKFVRLGQRLSGYPCPYSHVAFLTKAGTVIDAHPSWGVVERPYVETEWDRTMTVDIEIDESALRKLIGLPYDYLEIVLWPFGTDWQHRFFCSELVAAMLKLPGEYSPGRLYKTLENTAQ